MFSVFFVSVQKIYKNRDSKVILQPIVSFRMRYFPSKIITYKDAEFLQLTKARSLMTSS